MFQQTIEGHTIHTRVYCTMYLDASMCGRNAPYVFNTSQSLWTQELAEVLIATSYPFEFWSKLVSSVTIYQIGQVIANYT